MTIYYSDQRDAQHSQKIVQQTTSDDYDSWGSAIDVVATQFKEDQPGVPTATKVHKSFIYPAPSIPIELL